MSKNKKRDERTEPKPSPKRPPAGHPDDSADRDPEEEGSAGKTQI